MARWAPDAAVRLERAALDLFAEQGYPSTTVQQIADRAGLKSRSFFRYFSDKREVLFLRQREFGAVVGDLLNRAPDRVSAVQLIRQGFVEVTRDLDSLRSDLAARRAVIRSDDHLLERDLLKSKMLSDEIERALLARGMNVVDGALLASASVLVFNRSLDEWLSRSDGTSLEDILDRTWNRVARISREVDEAVLREGDHSLRDSDRPAARA